ncbi:MAG TPA: tetratricopeptide repeat protein [Bacteroidia bacterium]|nr:tetratricopeptide repeat protein [Bacteroidia bacterium]
MKYSFKSYHIALALFVVAIIAACSTTKNTFVTRTYHNLTSRYNGYFYAKESMKDASDKIEKTYEDDFSQLLPVFRIPNTPASKGCYPDLEKAIKKATLVIERHAITNKAGVEIAGAVKWTDENYLIIGQAHYYKQEFIPALELFEYIINKYPKNPSQNVAIMWKARTLVQLGDYTNAEGQLDVVGNNKTLTESQQGEVKASYADLYIHTGNYPNAIKYLEEAIPLTKRRKTRARYTFILAQLYEVTGDNKKAADYFGDVIRMNPQYDMLFNAKLNRARLSASTATNRTAAKRELEKMLLDEKNKEYQDQIYYTLAQLEQSGNNTAGAITYYKLSVASSFGNNKQKAVSYLALGDLSFNAEDYKQAGAYYDSTMMFLPKDYKGYNAIGEKRKSLGNLVKYLNIISLEDSLQKVVSVYGGDTTTLYAFIDKKIEEAKKEEERKKKELEERMNSGDGNNPLSLNPNSPQNPQNQPAGQWYFYNPSTVGFGVNEFTRKWGNRKLEDNWRRANKETFLPEENPDEIKDTVKGGAKKVASNQTREYYLRDLPMTKEKMDKSNEAIADALYNLGSIYKDQMNNLPKAAETFEALCVRFPNHKYALPSHFQLFRIYQKTGNKVKEKEHSDFICKNYPTSDYCQLITNPEHESQVLAEREKVRIYYDSTYEEYSRRNFAAVVTRSNYADSTFGTRHEHAAKFAYIRAISLGKTQGTPQMESALVKLIENFPKDPVRLQAQKMLDFIRKSNNGMGVVPGDSGAPAAAGYVANEKVEFQYMVVVQNGAGDINKFKAALSDFNTANYGSAQLGISSVVLDPTRQAILVKKFVDQAAAMAYYNNLKSRPEIFAWLNAGTFQAMVISTENFPLFLKNKDVEGYKKFFDEKILNKK